jgi:hypothetical protein
MPFGIEALRRLTEQGQEVPALAVRSKHPLPVGATVHDVVPRAFVLDP